MEEAIAGYGEAIGIRHGLRVALEPAGEWSPGLANDLATTHSRRGFVLERNGGLDSALSDWQAACEIHLALAQNGSFESVLSFLELQRWVVGAAVDVQTWDMAAQSLLSFMGTIAGLEQDWEEEARGQRPWQEEMAAFVDYVQTLEKEQRAQILSRLGEHADWVASALQWE